MVLPKELNPDCFSPQTIIRCVRKYFLTTFQECNHYVNLYAETKN